MGTIWVLRHGQTTANAQEVIQGPRIDAPLSDLGVRQAASLGDALAGQPIEAVYSSPLVRARDTAEALVRRHQRYDASAKGQLAVQVVPELYEMDYGAFVGRNYTEIRDEMDQVLDAWRMGFVDQPFPGGESATLAQHRIRPFAKRIVEAARDRQVAVVAHGRINRVLIATLTGAGLTRLEEFPQSNASITELDVNGHVTVKRLNDTKHLALASDAFS
ncbi:MAG: histidine phosphatase family protein [Candidatus Thermoplasmatota archaeon]